MKHKIKTADKALILHVLFIFILVVISALVTFGQTTLGKPWRDRSPHKAGFVSVNSVKLHYLDWGGKGGDMLFLTGYGSSAHIYDELAPKFTDKFRVLALTRRGHGESEKPADGFDTENLTEDIRQFLDRLKIKRVTLVGHSMAGKELALFASLYPEKVEKLVFLDSANDYLNVFEVFKDAPNNMPPASALASFDEFYAFYKSTKCGWNDAWEADMRKTFVFTESPEWKFGGPVMTENAASKIRKGIEASNPDYTKIKAPALSFYALGPFPECTIPKGASEEERAKTLNFLNGLKAHLTKGMERFKRELPTAEVILMPDTDHYFFIQDQDLVVKQMRRFLLSKTKTR